ncbi:histidine phosphatase family protein [Oricola sp.]|uniref:SixA phosphatase family protein n=1 Tax=Oricola sp. TaxID=1979950 RepID=UPI00320BBBCC|nr:histidine phosphatase family protein [Oricola sp.]
MKTLYLLRHAKSSWDDPSLDDFDRPLSKRGRKAAPLIGRYMAERNWQPDLALVSPAVRARDTWHLVASEMPKPVETRFEPSIYMAEPEALLALLRNTDTPGSVILVGHNPGLEQLAARLAGPGSQPQAHARMAEKYPTAALARFEVHAMEPCGAILTDFVRARDIADTS